MQDKNVVSLVANEKFVEPKEVEVLFNADDVDLFMNIHNSSIPFNFMHKQPSKKSLDNIDWLVLHIVSEIGYNFYKERARSGIQGELEDDGKLEILHVEQRKNKRKRERENTIYWIIAARFLFMSVKAIPLKEQYANTKTNS